ncbi:MAG: tetratricopeptide repeat protein [Alphaproteobacteria bacterium]
MTRNIILILFFFNLVGCTNLAESFKFAKKDYSNDPTNISVLEQNKDYRALALAYENLYNKDTTNMLYLYKSAENHRLSHNFKAAINHYNKLIENNTDLANAYEGLILCYIEEADLTQVTNLINKIIAIDATRWRPINATAVMFALNNHYNEAISYFDLALNIEKNYSILNNKALTMAFNGNIKSAIPVMEEAVTLIADTDLNKSKTAMNLALIYGISGDMEKAEQTLKPYLNEAQIYNNLAIYASLVKDSEKSKQYLVKALDANNYYEKAERNLKIIDK